MNTATAAEDVERSLGPFIDRVVARRFGRSHGERSTDRASAASGGFALSASQSLGRRPGATAQSTMSDGYARENSQSVHWGGI